MYNLEGGEAGEVDAQMVEALRPSIEEAEPVGTQEMALDYIGKRGAQVGLLAGVGRPALPACCTPRLGMSQRWHQQPGAAAAEQHRHITPPHAAAEVVVQ